MAHETDPSSRSQSSSWLWGLLYILGVSAFAFWTRFSSKFKTPPQQSTESISPSTESSEKQNDRNKFPLLPTQIPPAPTNTENAHKRDPHKTPWWKVALEIGTFLAALGAVGAASVYAWLTYRMWGEMQTQSCIQRQTSVNAERAWVGLDVPLTLDSVDQFSTTQIVFKGHYSIKNFGKGPATKVIQFGNFLNPDEGLEPSKKLEMQKREADSLCDSAIKFATGTVPVGGGLEQPAPFGYTLFPNQSHNEPIGGQISIETMKFLLFVGCVAYLDQFKAVHWTRFAMWRGPYNPKIVQKGIPKLDFYSLYNDTDQPKEQPCHGEK